MRKKAPTADDLLPRVTPLLRRPRPLAERVGGTESRYLYGAAWGYLTDYSGMQQLGARFYWPEVGRFMQQDPIGDAMNWYEYAGGSPLDDMDPTGLLRVCWHQRRKQSSSGTDWGQWHYANTTEFTVGYKYVWRKFVREGIRTDVVLVLVREACLDITCGVVTYTAGPWTFGSVSVRQYKVSESKNVKAEQGIYVGIQGGTWVEHPSPAVPPGM